MIPIGVVVPAWNEAQALPLLLASMLRQRGVVLDVVVVANGCSDATAAIAERGVVRFQSAGHRLRVMTIDQRSKIAALNLGDKASGVFPRAYIDADVVLTAGALAAVGEVLATPLPRLASPRLRFSAEDPAAERMARLVELLPPFVDDVVGGGFYAVNAAGRARWRCFPPVIADDAFVCGLFERRERILAREAAFTARFPSRVNLPLVLARWADGNAQLRSAGHRVARTSRLTALRTIIGRPDLWLAAAGFARLKLAARRQAQRDHPDERAPWPRADQAKATPSIPTPPEDQAASARTRSTSRSGEIPRPRNMSSRSGPLLGR